MLEFDTMRGERKNYTESINMKTLMKTAMKTIMKSSLCALAAFVLSSSSAFATALDTTLFAKKSDITISGYAGSTTLANFPVLVAKPGARFCCAFSRRKPYMACTISSFDLK